jgi:hypothetical protein
MNFKLNVDEIPSVFSDGFIGHFSIRSPTNTPISPINIDFSNIVPGWVPYNERPSGFDADWEQEYYDEPVEKKSYIDTPMKPITLLQIAEYEKKNKSSIKKSQVISQPEKPKIIPKPTAVQTGKQQVIQKGKQPTSQKADDGWGQVVGKKKQNKSKFNRRQYDSEEETEKKQDDRNVDDLEDNFFDYNLVKNRNEDNAYW